MSLRAYLFSKPSNLFDTKNTERGVGSTVINGTTEIQWEILLINWNRFEEDSWNKMQY